MADRSRISTAVRSRVARLAALRRSSAPPLYFVHIMKTGGTALTTAMARLCAASGAGECITEMFLDQFVQRHAWDGVGFVTGHLPWEAHELLPAATRTMTVLRDPVERTLSHYWQLSINPDVVAESPGFSLEEFVESPRWNTLCRNYQARQLAHRVGLAGAGTAFDPAARFAQLGPPFPRTHQYPLQSLFDCEPLALDDNELEAAARRSLAEIEFVGVTDHLDDLYRRVAGAVWSVADPPPLGRENTAPDRPRRQTAPTDLIRRIEEMTAVDRVLYEAARARA